MNILLLPLVSYNAVLRVEWLETVWPLLLDFKNLTMQVIVGKKKVCLQGQAQSKDDIIMDYREGKKLPSRRILLQLTTKEGSEKQNIPPFLQPLLQTYSSIFLEPQRLPPIRGHEHHIILYRGTDPISVRPCR